MRIKLKLPMSGPAGAFHSGAIVEVDGKKLTEAAARKMVKDGVAEEWTPKAPAKKDAAPADKPGDEKGDKNK